jgi:hypothetical protein
MIGTVAVQNCKFLFFYFAFGLSRLAGFGFHFKDTRMDGNSLQAFVRWQSAWFRAERGATADASTSAGRSA